MTRFILKAIEARRAFVEYLQRHIPGLEVCWDQKRDAFDTFRRSLALAGDDPAIHLEDDIVLTRDFVRKALDVVSIIPGRMVQFFSMRQSDLTIGSRWDQQFQMTQAYYAPAGYSAAQLRFFPRWAAKHLAKNPQGYDTMIQHWLKERGEPYWIHCPSLVDHRVAKSQIDPRRSSKRQSFTFRDPQDG